MQSIHDIIEYLELKTEFLKTKAQRDVLNIISYAVVRLIIVLVMSMFFLMFTVALGFLIGHWFGNQFAGFLIIAGFYFILGLTLILLRKKISNYLFQRIYDANLELFKVDPITIRLENPAEQKDRTIEK